MLKTNMRTNGALVMLAYLAFAEAVTLTIDKSTSNCGEEMMTVTMGTEYVVRGTGESPGVDCSYIFKGEKTDNCMGLCYTMKSGSFFNDSKVSLTVVSGGHSKVYMQKEITTDDMWCGTEMTLSASLTVAIDYEFKPDMPGFDFSLAVYNDCQKPDSGSGKSITFEEALEHLDNYHHGAEFKDHENMTLVHGLLVGLCLASVFMIVLIVAYCYVKNSPNRGRASKKSMNVSTPREPGHKPENVQLLTVSTDKN